MSQVIRFKLAKAPPSKPRRVARVAVAPVVDQVAELQRRYRATFARATAWNVAIGVYAPTRSAAIH